MSIKTIKPAQEGTGSNSQNTVLTGLIGRGIQLSRSPAMHEAEGTAQGLHYVYRLFDTALMEPGVAIADILREAEMSCFAGVNVTYPYKVDVIDHLDELSESAAAVGAVNTVVFRDGKRAGHNTDMWGFAESFRRNMAGAAREKVLLAGAGGAGAAVSHALIRCGAGKLLVADSDAARAEHLAQAICAAYGAGRAVAFASVEAARDEKPDGIVNATPVGMASHPGCPVPAVMIEPHVWIADIIYFPLETELLRRARKTGCRVLSGSGMAVFQAVRAFELFTGLQADSARMEATFKTLGGPEPE